MRQVVLQLPDPAGNDTGQCAAVRRCLGGKVFHQFAVGRHAGTAGAVQPPLGGKIGIGGQEIALQCIAPDELNQETLSAPVPPDEKAHGAAALADLLKIGQQCSYFVRTPDGNVRRSRTGNHTGRHRGQKRPQNAPGNLDLIGRIHITHRQVLSLMLVAEAR